MHICDLFMFFVHCTYLQSNWKVSRIGIERAVIVLYLLSIDADKKQTWNSPKSFWNKKNIYDFFWMNKCNCCVICAVGVIVIAAHRSHIHFGLTFNVQLIKEGAHLLIAYPFLIITSMTDTLGRSVLYRNWNGVWTPLIFEMHKNAPQTHLTFRIIILFFNLLFTFFPLIMFFFSSRF